MTEQQNDKPQQLAELVVGTLFVLAGEPRCYLREQDGRWRVVQQIENGKTYIVLKVEKQDTSHMLLDMTLHDATKIIVVFAPFDQGQQTVHVSAKDTLRLSFIDCYALDLTIPVSVVGNRTIEEMFVITP